MTGGATFSEASIAHETRYTDVFGVSGVPHGQPTSEFSTNRMDSASPLHCQLLYCIAPPGKQIMEARSGGRSPAVSPQGAAELAMAAGGESQTFPTHSSLLAK